MNNKTAATKYIHLLFWQCFIYPLIILISGNIEHFLEQRIRSTLWESMHIYRRPVGIGGLLLYDIGYKKSPLFTSKSQKE